MNGLPEWLNDAVVLLGAVSIVVGIVMHFSNRKYQEYLRLQDVERQSTEDKIDNVSEALERLDKDVRILKSQLMTEERVDAKLEPIRQEVTGTKLEMKELRDELRSGLNEQNKNIQTLLASMGEVQGYLKALTKIGLEK